MRRALPALLLTLMLAPAAHAADPIMPLSQVRPGLDCVGLSVIRGTQISQFDVEIIDVVGGQTGLGGPRVLVRASGPPWTPPASPRDSRAHPSCASTRTG